MAELEFRGSRKLPEWMAQDCRICLQVPSINREYHMPAGTEVVALKDGYYAHADHTAEERKTYDRFLDNLDPEVKRRIGLL